MVLEFKVKDENIADTLQVFLRKEGVSYAVIKKLKFLDDGITVDNIKQNTNYILSKGQTVRLNIFDRSDAIEKSTVIPQDIPLDIKYLDDRCMVVNKPYDMPVHPSLKHADGTLANGFCGFFKNKGEERLARVVNRLDKNTSGLVLIALDALAAEEFKHRVYKEYMAIVHGRLLQKAGVIEEPIGREGDSIITRAVMPDGQYARTQYEVLKENDDFSLVRVWLSTGRTHQIRVHFSFIGHPLAGDDLYGGDKLRISRHALHCGFLRFFCIKTGEMVEITADIPDDMEKIISEI